MITQPDSIATAITATNAATICVVSTTRLGKRDSGKKVVIGGVLDHLCARHGPGNVHVIAIGDPGVARDEVPFQLYTVATPTPREQVSAVLRRVVGRPHSPLQQALLYSEPNRRRVRRLLDEIGAGVELWDTIRAAQFAPVRSKAHRVLLLDDLFSRRYDEMLTTLRSGRDIDPLGEYGRFLPPVLRPVLRPPAVYRPLLRIERRFAAAAEQALPRRFDRTLLLNPEEAALLGAATGLGTIRSIPPSVPGPARALTRADSAHCAFIGRLDYPPNVDGLDWFLRSCREHVLERVPEFRLSVIGAGNYRGGDAAAAWGQRLRFLGFVDDLDDVLGTCAAVLSPLRIGGGAKIKVVEALARGLPVVATARGADGLGLGLKDGVIIADTPVELATMLASVIDPPTNRFLSTAARRTWEQRFSPTAVARTYDALFSAVRAESRSA